MKKFFLILSLGCVIISCGNNSSDAKGTAADSATGKADKPEAQDPDISKGLALVANNDCLTCHKLNEQLTGPAYQAVAERYTATPDVIDTLSSKVISGGSGKWGSIPMSPHPALSKEDATAMVKYILSLKK